MRLRWLLPGLLAVLGLCGTVLAQPGASASEFARRLDRAAQLAEAGEANPSAGLMSQLREVLGLPVDLQADGWHLAVPADPLLESLSGADADEFRRAGDRVRQLQGALQEALARDVPLRATVDDALVRAYSGVIQDQPGPAELALGYLGQAVSAILYQLVRAVAGSGGFLIWALLIALLTGAVLVVFRSRVVPDRAGVGTRRGQVDERVDWLARADEAARAGDAREAVRAFYLALLAALARRGFLAEAPALTAGEARSAVRRSHPTIYPTVVRATGSYERVVYGGEEPEEGDLTLMREAVAEVRRK